MNTKLCTLRMELWAKDEAGKKVLVAHSEDRALWLETIHAISERHDLQVDQAWKDRAARSGPTTPPAEPEPPPPEPTPQVHDATDPPELVTARKQAIEYVLGDCLDWRPDRVAHHPTSGCGNGDVYHAYRGGFSCHVFSNDFVPGGSTLTVSARKRLENFVPAWKGEQ